MSCYRGDTYVTLRVFSNKSWVRCFTYHATCNQRTPSARHGVADSHLRPLRPKRRAVNPLRTSTSNPSKPSNLKHGRPKAKSQNLAGILWPPPAQHGPRGGSGVAGGVRRRAGEGMNMRGERCIWALGWSGSGLFWLRLQVRVLLFRLIGSVYECIPRT